MKQEYMKAFAEVNEIIKLMPQELVNKIPIKFKEMLKEDMDTTYVTNIYEPLENCKLMNETIIILGLIYRDFWSSPEERKILQEKDAKELKAMQDEIEKEMRKKYNPDNIFKNKREIRKEEQLEEKSLIVIQEYKWYKKIFNLIKKLFNIN